MQVPWLRFPAEVPNAMPSEAGITVRYSQSVAKETDRRSPERRGPQFQHLQNRRVFLLLQKAVS
jgi:hypothetical protein